MKLNVITLFSGYDSQCLALDRLKRHNPQFDYDLVAWAEIDPHAIKAHNALFPQWAARNLGDVSKVDWQQFATMINEPIDLLTYSSPCQDFSQAGLQRGGEKGSGTRSSLLWECERAIETLRPKYLLMENVAALVTQKFLPLFNRWQGVLEKLGYANYAQVLNSKNYGVPQNRERIFLVSVRSDCKPSPYYFPKPFPLEKRLKDVLQTNVPDRYYLSQERLAGLKLSNEKEKVAGRGFEFAPKSADSVGDNAVSTNAGGRKTDNFLQEPCIDILGNLQPDNNRKEGGIRQQNQVVSGDGRGNAVTAEHSRHAYKIADPLLIANPHGYYEGGEYSETSPTVRSSAFQANTAVAEPLPAAARGRAAGDWHTSDHRQTLELGDPAAANSVTSVAKDSMIVEPAILQQQRTEEGKEIRRQHKGDKGIPYSHKELSPRGDGISNTLSTVEKDNLLAEPTIIDTTNSCFEHGGITQHENISPTLRSQRTGLLATEPAIIEDFYPDRPARVYEEQAPTIRSDRTGLKVTEPAVLGWTRSGDSKGEPTYHPVDVANCVTAAKRDNTQNYVVEPQVQQVGQLYGKESNPQYGRIYNSDGVSPTLVSHGSTQGIDMPKVIEPTRQDLIQYHLTDDGNLRAYIDDEKKTGVSELQITNPDNPAPTLMGANHAKVWQSIEELIEQAKTAHPSRGIILIKNTPCWVRRLTERELFRLMDVDENDIDTLLNAGISNTQLAKLAGNSVVTACMYYIFHALFIETTPPPNTQTQLF